jgi:hypothetical protein
MYMLREAGPRPLFEVHAHVKAVRIERVPKPPNTSVNSPCNPDLLLNSQGVVSLNFMIWDDEQVPVVVRVLIHEDEHLLAAPQNEILLVIVVLFEAGEERALRISGRPLSR